MFQKFEQTMVNLKLDTMDLYHGMKLMRDLSFTTNCYVLVFLLFSYIFHVLFYCINA